MGNLLGFAIILVSIITGLIFGIRTGGITFVTLAYLLTLLIVVSYYLTMPSKGSPSYHSMPLSLRETFRTYHFQIRTPGAGTEFSALINSMRFAGVVWGIVTIIKGHYTLGAAALALFPLTALFVARFAPYLYFTAGVKRGNKVAMEQLDLIERATAQYQLHHRNRRDASSTDAATVHPIGTYEDPIIVGSTSEIYTILRDQFPGYTFRRQTLLSDDRGRKIDRMSISTAQGEQRDLHFWVTKPEGGEGRQPHKGR